MTAAHASHPQDPKDYPGGIITQDRDIKHAVKLAERYARFHKPIPVLITGETGTGKELIARYIHDRNHKRKNHKFIAVNCGAISPHLFESEFFGHVKGAFTDAASERKGYIELAKHGTLFLDEIGDMPLDMQVKLLRVLQEGTFFKVGGVQELTSEFQLVAATNANLQSLVREKKFRADLYYRICIGQIHLKPLRERNGDIELLAEHILEEFIKEQQLPHKSFSTEALKWMRNHPWVGNVRELTSTIMRATIISEDEIIGAPEIIAASLLQKDPDSPPLPGNQNLIETIRSLLLEKTPYLDIKRQTEKALFMAVLEHHRGNAREAARIMGINPRTLYNRMKELDIPRSYGRQGLGTQKIILIEALRKAEGSVAGAAAITSLSVSTIQRRMNRFRIPFGYGTPGYEGPEIT